MVQGCKQEPGNVQLVSLRTVPLKLVGQLMHNHVTQGPVQLQQHGQYGEPAQFLVVVEFKVEQEIAPQGINQNVHQELFLVNKEIAMMIHVQLMEV